MITLPSARYVAIASAGLVFGLAAAASAFFQARKFEAAVVLSTVSNTRGGSLASQLLGPAANGSLQATPPLVVRLTQLQSVLLPVARSRDGTGQVLIERLAGKSLAHLTPSEEMALMRRTLVSSYDRETGLVTLEVVHRDSSLARLLVGRVVDQCQRVFAVASRAQGREMRSAMAERVEVQSPLAGLQA